MRFLRHIALASVLALCLSFQLGSAAEKPSTPDQIARLIADLGSEEYTVRESATEQLAIIGLPAFAALEAAANHPDREVRYRAQRVLGLIRRLDSERRLEAFLTGKDDANDYPLPAWGRFSKNYGDGPEQRKLFVEMQRADAELLRALEDNPRRAAETLSIRLASTQLAVQLQNQPISLAQITALLFAAAEPDVTAPAQTLTLLFNQCFQPAVREAIATGSRREMPRKMLGSIISRSEDLTAFQALSVATQFKLPEGIIPATKILKSNDLPRMAPLIQHALIAIAKLGDASHLPLVDTEKLMRDQTQVAQFKENDTVYTIQLRDVALAAALVISQQDLRSYFDIPRNQPFDDPQMIFLNARLIGFPSDAKRAEVFAKWEKHKATQSATP